MKTLRYLLAVSLLVLAVAACRNGSGDDSGATISPSTPEASATADGGTPGASPTEEPSSGDGEPTATPEPGDNGDGDGDGGETPAPDGTPALGPADISEYAGRSFQAVDCTYDRTTSLADCPPAGVFSISPPLTGEDISCNLFVEEEDPVVISCRSGSPPDATYYEVQ
jgi:hypothetical protein